MKILSVVGARPNFMKIAPFSHAISKWNNSHPLKEIEHILLHTGQHYDDSLSQSFFQQLNIPMPDIKLGIGSGTHAEQVGKTMIAFEKVIHSHKPDWVVVVGDVNATLACSITAKKEHIKVCHIEAGLRSRDMAMPEEINRVVTDRLSDLLLTPDKFASKNLLEEGISKNHIVLVGNIMVDTLEANLKKASQLDSLSILKKNLLSDNIPSNFPEEYGLMTMHRPSNVDEKKILYSIIHSLIDNISSKLPIIWPIHPRTLKQLKKFGLWEQVKEKQNIYFLEPVSYHEMLHLNLNARIMFTDSGGLQEECCILGTPCLTLRWNTERPITLKDLGGVSLLVGNDIKIIETEFEKMITNNYETPSYRPKLWDGQTAVRCLRAIMRYDEIELNN